MGREMGCENPSRAAGRVARSAKTRRNPGGKKGARERTDRFASFRVISCHFAYFFAFYRVLRAFVLVYAILHPFCTVQRVVSRTLISREMRPGEAFPVENPFSPAAPAKTRPARDG
jgi:hypothetical protein